MLSGFVQSAAPFDIATCMYDTGIDPFTGQAVAVSKGLQDRKAQRALMQFFKPENYFQVPEALIEAWPQDLIGGCEGLIPANPLKEAQVASGRDVGIAPHRGSDVPGTDC